MITKEQHGNCSKESENKECEGAGKADSDVMNGFDPGGREDGSSTTKSRQNDQNIPTDDSTDLHDKSSDKIHSETKCLDKNTLKGEKPKLVNDCIELSTIPSCDVSNGTTAKTNTQPYSPPPPSNSSLILINEEPQIKMSDTTAINCNKDENGKTPGPKMAKSAVNNHSSDDTSTPIENSSRRGVSRLSIFSRLPLLFERATPSYFTPRFDSRVLEEQYWKSTFPRTTRRFQLGLIYLLFLTIALSVYFPAGQRPTWPAFLGLTLGTVSIVAGMLGMIG